jgi:stage II sporulation protein D
VKTNPKSGVSVRKAVFAVMLGAVACASAMPRTIDDLPIDEGDQPVRIALATSAENASVGGTGTWRIYSRNSANLVTSGTAGTTTRIERRGSQLVAMRANGSVTSRQTAPLLVRATSPGSFVTFNGKRYRGELIIRPASSGLLVVNRLGVESYLRGVVPLEIGGVAKPGDEAAVEAQAVAARTYSYKHLDLTGNRGFDMYASVQDQAYGGVDAEQAMSDQAIENTRNMVLKYAGRVINTPYSSTCGGRTAEVREVWWRRNDEPYLRSVSDQIPGTDRHYCDLSGRFRWTTTFDQAQLRETLEKYLATVTPESEPAVAASATSRRTLGRITGFAITGRTPHDRVASVSIQTERGNYVVRGNDVRFVLRNPSGGLLNSTYFTAESRTGSSGAIEQLTIRGGGWGHGIGMCQWGAIGRARAGQDYRTILTSYYQGTSVERIDS